MLSALAVAAAAAAGVAAGAPVRGPSEALNSLEVPAGFEVEYHCAEGAVPGARSLALAAGGTLFVGTRGPTVYAVLPGCADVRVLSDGFDTSNGVALRGADLYIAEVSRLWVVRDAERAVLSGAAVEPELVFDEWPTEEHHGWKYLRFDPDSGRLFAPIGAPCNICNEPDPFNTIVSLDVDRPEGGIEIEARGVRNTVGFDFHPVTGDLWATENGRDFLGDDQPPDEIITLRTSEPAAHFGYPWCHGTSIPDPELNPDGAIPCTDFVPPVYELPAHVAPLGAIFYTGTSFPAGYGNNTLIFAEHGSWNRSTRIGYRVSTFDIGTGEYKQLIEGWLLPDDDRWGRPVDLVVDVDGSVLISDDFGGAIFRLVYRG